MDHFKHIYSHNAQAYHQMISSEDVDSNLLPALERVTSFNGKIFLDLGTGTGRLPILLRKHDTYTIGFDLHRAMLLQNQTQREKAGGDWELVQGDMHDLPFPTRWANVVAAGWAIGHLRSWYASQWQAHIGYVLDQMHRVVKQDGALIVIETLGTGSLSPLPPTAELAEYYDWLESERGFKRQEIQTDYVFPSVGAAVEYTEFFFGVELAKKIRRNGWSRLPEWTGVWGKRMKAGE
jgi:ubiquinone/menaquinone biosynthesis C-methylase UbiE